MSDFAFYSTDINPTKDPQNADPAPAQLVVLDEEPSVDGTYSQQEGDIGRGGVIKTLGGIVTQDFGIINGDQRITISDRDALTATTIAALKALHETIDGEYWFTDGHDVYKVRFARPNGFRCWRNLLWAAHGLTIYSYEINLIVMSPGTTTTTTTSTTTTTTTTTTAP